ncbi:MAG: MBL fold metallo-hydrolase [Acidobacteria bacterium]|nr:MBL fold metallo-hydrolase [Acidobacteriota bacterium]MBI3280675.1 MBL fold metallo-hydrolase [Acidobacteriota bacterium]
MRDIRDYRVEKGAIAIWWLGQNGFIFKSPEGTLAAVDLYLTDSCNGLHAGIDLSRRVPILLPPEELEVDVFTCTHNHQDHTDPETIRALRHKDTMQFAGPHPSCRVFGREGIESGRITPAWPDCEIEFRDLKIRGTFALPTDTSDLNHMGYVFQFGSGPKVYVTGDTDYSELLLGVTKHSPDLMITCINGGFNNMSHFEAAEIAGKIKPKAAIPCHYDMFPDNAADPSQFRASLALRAEGVRYQPLAHGEPFLFGP